MNNTTYILAYMFKDTKGNLQDRYITYETLAEAQEAYDNEVINDNCYSCNICKVIKSTDY
jgi:hypothetical protein